MQIFYNVQLIIWHHCLALAKLMLPLQASYHFQLYNIIWDDGLHARLSRHVVKLWALSAKLEKNLLLQCFGRTQICNGIMNRSRETHENAYNYSRLRRVLETDRWFWKSDSCLIGHPIKEPFSWNRGFQMLKLWSRLKLIIDRNDLNSCYVNLCQLMCLFDSLNTCFLWKCGQKNPSPFVWRHQVHSSPCPRCVRIVSFGHLGNPIGDSGDMVMPVAVSYCFDHGHIIYFKIMWLYISYVSVVS